MSIQGYFKVRDVLLDPNGTPSTTVAGFHHYHKQGGLESAEGERQQRQTPPSVNVGHGSLEWNSIFQVAPSFSLLGLTRHCGAFLLLRICVSVALVP